MRIRYSTEKNGKPVKKAIVYTREEHGINFNDVDTEAVEIIERLRAAGYETYIVGGAVRDLILGKKPKDFDIVTAASPSRIKKIFRNARIIGHRFRLVHVYYGPKIFEVSTFRSLKDGPTSNTYGTIEEDVMRRDFSLNALFYDPGKQIVVDYVGGMKDIREKRIRPIIPLSTIFKDDPVRMIRAVKYGTIAGFSLPLLLRWKIKGESRLLTSVSPSRLTEELLKIIHSPAAARIVENLEAHGLYEYLQPGASKLLKENSGFRDRYIKSLGAINQPGFTGVPGEALAAFIRDFLEDYIDWEGGGIAENYKNAFLAARQFVLPMNPPRAELDHGVRLIFADHGITIKKSRFSERGGRPSHPPVRQGSPGREGGEGVLSEGEGAAKRHHRPRRHKKNPAPANPGAPPPQNGGGEPR
ncbi:MAG: polynucleotide adenylyltransferase PcnB [Treponema sp.]|nr:polynucleotide adenylyltransferase PcnB [Treponema sp.]